MADSPLSNKAIAGQLKEAARLLEVLDEDDFRARAYQNAARSIEAYEGEVFALIGAGRLTDLRGVGAGLARELSSLKREPTLAVLEDLRERVPPGVRELFRVSGLGGKKIGTLWRSGVTSLEELVAVARAGQLAELRGFGKKSAESTLQAAEFALLSQRRMRLDVAEVLASVVFGSLRDALPTAEIHLAGSFRRRLETVGNLNLVIAGAETDEVVRALEPLGEVRERTERSVSASLEGREVYVQLVNTAQLGAALLYDTGSAAYRERLLERAEARGLELGAQGLSQDGQPLATPTEAAALERLELPYVVPERREWAEVAAEPELIELNDLRGLVHNHSLWSDASASIAEMVAAARERGYSYYGTGDHSRSSFYANGLSIERVLAQAEEIRALRAALEAQGSDFALLHGLEVDILPDGSLDYPDEVLATLDYAVVSVHQQFQLSEKEQTRRIIRAIEHPRSSILGHLTGRLLLRRPSYAVDIEAVLGACAATGTIVELNANPQRLDLDWRWVARGKELGCRFAINPDAHAPAGLDDARYGVWMARKAGLSPADVVNTASDGAAFLHQLKSAGR